uniref:Uncharacterized protein n=1 Tax=Meloidogyne floridensis TaxID=298350 RepID=A0A915NNB7_9BILA
MWLFFLFIFLNSLFTFVSPYSIFVKISWRENAENYYESLAEEYNERFKLELTGAYLNNPIIGKTDMNDTFHFADQNIYGDNFKLTITINRLNLDIGTINQIENDSIIYIIPRKDNTKYIKYIKVDERQNFFNTIIHLFNNLRVLVFVWPIPMESSQKFNIMIKCKDTDNTDFVANMNNFFMDEEGIQQYQSTKYIKTIVCPNDEYSIIFEEV